MYVTVSTSLSALSVVCSVVSLYVYHNRQFKHRPPKFIRNIAQRFCPAHFNALLNTPDKTPGLTQLFQALRLGPLTSATSNSMMSIDDNEAIKSRLILQEWRMIVAVVDHFLFITFAMTSLGVAISLLLIKPLLKNTHLDDIIRDT